jgi:predicted transcriptional regulator
LYVIVEMRYCNGIAMRIFSRNALGHLESRVMDVLWARGESSVRDVSEQLERPLAYTTVMTTLDRLFKKGVLARRKAERAFVYWPVAPNRADLLISALLDEAGRDPELLNELERKIRLKRKELGK